MTPVFSNKNISLATLEDIPVIMDLLNSAYRGERSKQGWTTEAHLIAGESRIDEKMLSDVLQMKGSVLLKYQTGENKIVGCVNLQQHGEKIYLGMFSVSPELQGAGIGKQLLQAAEAYTRSIGCRAIYMSVVSVRTELINWYMRHGYDDTGERKPFPEDPVTGKHLQQLEFMIMEKKLAES